MSQENQPEDNLIRGLRDYIHLKSMKPYNDSGYLDLAAMGDYVGLSLD